MPKKPIAYRGDEPFVFVSYAHADAELAYPIISGLQERGMRIWFDDGLDVGDIWEDVIPDHVEQCAAMLCLVSTRFTDSNNCLDEIFYAREQKKELLILHLEDQALPRNFRFRYGRYHAERLSAYSDRSVLLERLTATQKLRCCIGQELKVKPSLEQPQKVYQEPTENPEMLFHKGRISKSDAEAVAWYLKAAELGHAGAMRELGRRCFNGYGVPKSYEDAFRWYLRAAEKGNWEAMHQLDVCYTHGWGVTVDKKKAEYWRAKADQVRRIAFR